MEEGTGICFDHLLVELDLGEKPLLFSFDRSSLSCTLTHTLSESRVFQANTSRIDVLQSTCEVAKSVVSFETGICTSCLRMVGMSSPSCSWGVVRLCVKGGGLAGGKGGYGANIRHQQARPGSKKTTDFGSMRDLHGRRIRTVQARELLRRAERAEKKERSEGGGIEELEKIGKGEKSGKDASHMEEKKKKVLKDEDAEKERRRGIVEKMETTKHAVRSRLDAALSEALVSLHRQRGRKKVDQEKKELDGSGERSSSPSGSSSDSGDDASKGKERDSKSTKHSSKAGTPYHLDPLDLIDMSDDDGEDEEIEDEDGDDDEED
eukprot:TRINITY_DN401_c0_g1_i1.p1 TRINITY_DN401_c0_g1~~TRINITY_DN401_c0_g1_i1.p1  ORF type:complete len:321 (-),score=136.27 TRINITY_DN401_c0_g1_i1:1009-1971(-)